MFDVIVIGAGQAGLAAGYYLSKTHLRYTLLESQPEIGGSWQHYWASLRLFSPAKYSRLPGLDYPLPPDAYPTRDEVIAYLREYAAYFAIPVMTSAKVIAIQKRDSVFCIFTDDGRVLESRVLVDASGPFNRPYIPELPAMDAYRGCIMHTYDYHTPEPFKGQRVVVVGANNSAVQVGVELAQVAEVTLAVRRPIQWRSQRILGKNIFFWFHDTGLDTLPLGYFFDLEDINDVIDDGRYQQAIEAGHPNTRQMFTQFTESGVLWPDGEREQVDSVIFGTGFRADNKPYLKSLPALDKQGIPVERGGVSTTVEHLYFLGLFGQRSAASATLRGVGADAEYIVNRLQADLQRKRRFPSLVG